eukprot:3535749-Rhodomonas_salina.3
MSFCFTSYRHTPPQYRTSRATCIAAYHYDSTGHGSVPGIAYHMCTSILVACLTIGYGVAYGGRSVSYVSTGHGVVQAQDATLAIS